jgi:lipopolysaccharide export system permease protein
LWESSDLNKHAELQWRVAMPVSCIVLTLLAVPLSRLRPRQGRYSRVWVAVVIYFLYQNLITIGKVWIARGLIPEIVGLWWTHAAVVLLALAVILGPSVGNRIRYKVRGL